MYEDITTGEIINTLKCTHKWKTPGVDKITYLQESWKSVELEGCSDAFCEWSPSNDLKRPGKIKEKGKSEEE